MATAILHGHPGPRCLNEHITTYILTGVEPNFREVESKEILRADASTAIKQVTITVVPSNDERMIGFSEFKIVW